MSGQQQRNSKHFNSKAVRQLLEDLDELGITDRLHDKYFEQWQSSDPPAWPMIAAKLEVLADLRAELRSIANQGVDDA